LKNKTIFKKNLAALSERHPLLAEKVEQAAANGPYRLIKSGTNHYNLLVDGDSGRMLFYDPDDPFKSAQKYLEGLKVKFAPFVIFMGLGLGYHLHHFFSQFGEGWKTQQVVIFEKDIELFHLALTTGDYTGILKHPKVHFFVGQEPEESLVKLRSEILYSDYFALRSIKIIPLPASVLTDDSFYLRAIRTVKKAARQIMVAAGNDSFDALIGMENMFANLNTIFCNPGIKELYGRFSGKPGVLVAAGPSLNKNMHVLKDLRDNALIASCDASLAPLMNKGIRPHLVASMERTPGTDLFYSGITDFRDMYLITIPVLMPEAIAAFNGKKFVAYRSYFHFDWLEKEKGSLVSGISVANYIFKVLVELGCDPIILIGQDLAYAEDGDTHVKGNVFGHRDQDLVEKPAVYLEGNDGNQVKSEKIWEIIKLTYEDDLTSYSGTCINATEGGAKIRGAEVMTFREAADQHCRESFFPQAILDDVYNNFQGKDNVKDEYVRIHQKLLDTCNSVENMIDDFGAVLKDAHQAEKEIIQPFIEGNTDNGIDMERLLHIEEKWLELLKAIGSNRKLYDITYQTLQAYDIWLSSELSFLKDIYTNKEMLSMARVRKMTDWFAVVGSLLIVTRDVLKKAETQLENEMELEQ